MAVISIQKIKVKYIIIMIIFSTSCFGNKIVCKPRNVYCDFINNKIK